MIPELTITLAALSFGVAAFSYGTVFADARQRRAALARLELARLELDRVTTDLAKLHNDSAGKIIDIQDKLSQHELRLAGTTRVSGK